MSGPGSQLEATEASEAVTHGIEPSTRLRVALRALRWTYGTLAVELHLSPSTTRNWGLGRSPVPAEVLAWVELLAACHRANPPPGMW